MAPPFSSTDVIPELESPFVKLDMSPIERIYLINKREITWFAAQYSPFHFVFQVTPGAFSFPARY